MSEPRKTPQKPTTGGKKRPRKPPPQRIAQRMQSVVPPLREQADPAEAERAAVTAPPEPAGPPPLRLTAAAAVAGVEGLGVAAAGVTLFFAGTRNGVLGGLLVLVLAAIPLAAAYGLRRARRWSRGPALIIQLLSLPAAWTLLHSDSHATVVLGGVLGALALAGLVLLVHPATTDALGISRTAS